MPLTWNEQLDNALVKAFGKQQGSLLSNKYRQAFPAAYRDEATIDVVINDIQYLEKLNDTNPINIHFYYTKDNNEHPLHLRLYQWHQPIPLSDILPILENFDLRAYNEVPHNLTIDGHAVCISDFNVGYHTPNLNMDELKTPFQDAFLNIYAGRCENDGFNKLILGAGLSWHEIIILRAYAKYLRQVGFRFSQAYIEKALVRNPSITKKLVELFITRFCLKYPSINKTKQPSEREISENNIIGSINKAFENVTSLDEDRILRRLFELIQATLRTNYFQKTSDGKMKDYLSLKLSSVMIPELPLPKPLYEIFVYSPRFEGIHLRSSKVARGGIRWSDRLEDFRTEILGLMKAQKVKNAVIVPSGAKGGFVLKSIAANATRECIQKEVIHCYQSFIRGLLDITDNIIEKKFIKPKQTVCYDDIDPYLVVAADKGTATFSDLANSIAADYQFWLGDAFASGGSTGYDHKKMGITARGAWESIKRHFRELQIDVMQTDISVIGIGDMSGDVFGNGMIYSPHIKLLAAFDHRHIFLDPDPNPNESYKERVRLFNLPTSSWEDYNAKLISKGGGAYKRSLKSISLSPEIKTALAIDADNLTPNELIRAILKSPVDLVFNGGIGTYVKSSAESNADVGDRTNDYCRIDGNELRCKVVGEGGNLGFTQRGRVEYALNGGLINADFIDNSAGVDCSDHEVNLKILLADEVHKHKLSLNKRNELLASLTNEVASLVLQDNYSQALVMSFSAHHAKKNLTLHQNYIKELESQGILNRKVEFLPDDKTLSERKSEGLGLMRPELAVLLAYSKISLKNEILKSDVPDDAFLKQIVVTAFPEAVRHKYKVAIEDHRLQRDIIATQMSNHIINQMGFTYVYRIQLETGASVADIVRAHAVTSQIFKTAELQKSIEALDFKISMNDQYEMLFNIRNLINLATRWFLHTPYLHGNLEQLIETYSVSVEKLEEVIPTLMAGYTREYLTKLTHKFSDAGLPANLAQRIGTYRALYTSLNIIDIATKNRFDLIKTAKVYFASGERLSLVWFRDQLATDSREGHWNILARLTLRDELDICQRAYTIAIMNHDKKEPSTVKLIESWEQANKRILIRWEKILNMLHGTSFTEYTIFFIAIRELMVLIAV